MKLHRRYKTSNSYVAQVIELKTTGEFYIVANIFDKLNNHKGKAHFNAEGKIEKVNEKYGNLIMNRGE